MMHTISTYLGRGLVFDALSGYFQLIALIAGALVWVMTRIFEPRLERGKLEFYLLLALALAGMWCLASANDFLVLFLSLELITFSFYIMTAYLRTEPVAVEAALKYLILGGISSGVLVFGLSFLYGATGTLQFNEVAQKIQDGMAHPMFLALALVFILCALGFKAAAVPFHFWVPDVYEGAPTPVAAFISVGAKSAGFVALIRVLFSAFRDLAPQWMLIVSILAAMTILYGNLTAIPQQNIKRLFGYSSITHAGYLLIGVAAGSELGASAVSFYFAAYLFTNLLAFLVIVIYEGVVKSDAIADYAGLSQRSPLLAASMFLALLSLAGVPPLAGFFGKWYLLLAAVQRDLIWLAAIGAVNVAVSLYYYLLIVKQMYMHPPKDAQPIALAWPIQLTLYACLAMTLLIGIVQAPFLQLAQTSVASLF